jgi:hypothetical protein
MASGSYTVQPHPLDNTLFMLDAKAGTLKRLDATGKSLASAAIQVPPTPEMELASGLLFTNQPDAPAIGVFRYDETAFGEQIDNVLLVNPSGALTERDRVGDFIYHKGTWWVVLYAQQTKEAAVYLFDSQWNFLRELALGPQVFPISLHPWGDKVLVNTGKAIELLRVNAAGDVEVPFTPTLLSQSVKNANIRAGWLDLAWKSTAAGTLIMALLTGLWTYLQHVRSIVYRNARGRGAQPIDEYLDSLTWLPPEARRGQILLRHQRVVALVAIIGIATLIFGGLPGGAAHSQQNGSATGRPGPSETRN